MDSAKSNNYTISSMDLWRLEQKSINETFKWWKYVRWLSTFSFLSVGLIQIMIKGMDYPKFAFILTLVGITLLNVIYTVWLENMDSSHLYPYIHNILDVTIFSLAIYITGGAKSPFVWSYLIPILTSSITIGRLAGLIACFSSLFGMMTVLVLDNYRLLANVDSFSEYLLKISEMNTHNLISYICLFFLVYFISSFLSNTLRAQNKALAQFNNLLNKKNQQLLKSQKVIVKMERKATIDRMARTIQHELNNPMAIIALNMEMLLREQNRSIQDRLQPAWDAVIRMKNILNKIESLYGEPYREALEDIKILDIHQTEKCD